MDIGGPSSNDLRADATVSSSGSVVVFEVFGIGMQWFSNKNPSVSIPGVRAFLLLLVNGLLVAAVGCGPITASQRISSAKKAYKKASNQNAGDAAPYHYYKAKHYLYKAKEEWAYSNFAISAKYARKAERSAEEAVLKAREDPWPGHPVEGEKDDATSNSQ